MATMPQLNVLVVDRDPSSRGELAALLEREGFSTEDDQLPQRMFEPLQNGRLEGVALDREGFDHAMSLYYQMAGWGENGIPTEAKLAELDLTWANGH